MAESSCLAVDCGRAPASPPPTPRSYAGLDGAARDFDSLLRLLLDQLPRLAPDWSDRSEADLGMVLLELAAYAGDQLSYLQDRVALEGFLRTATQWESVRKHLRLIDAAIDEGYCAETFVVCECVGVFALFLPRGFVVQTAAAEQAAAVVYETVEDAVLHPALSRIALAVDAPSSLDGMQAVLGADLTGALAPGMWLLLEQGSQREWAQVAGVAFAVATTTVTFAQPLGARYTAGEAELYGNRVRATHGATKTVEAIGDGSGGQRLALPLAPLIRVWDVVAQQAVSTLAVSIDGTGWTEVEDFIDAEAAARVFTVTRDNLGYLTLQFGDGAAGAAPAVDGRIRAVYRVGDPAANPAVAGQVGADTLTEFDRDCAFANPSQHVTRIRNPFAASAPRAPQTLEQAKLLGPAQLRVQNRAVVPADYETLLARGLRVGGQLIVPLASRARVVRTGSWNTVVVSVELPGRAPLAATPGLREACENLLVAHKMAGLDVQVEDARYCAVHLALRIDVDAAHFARDVRLTVEHALLTAPEAPFAPGRLGFGQAVYLSDIYAVVTAVPGVAAAAVTRFKRLGDRYPDRESQGFIEVDALQIARCDNDPAHTEFGVLRLHTCGGKPG